MGILRWIIKWTMLLGLLPTALLLLVVVLFLTVLDWVTLGKLRKLDAVFRFLVILLNQMIWGIEGILFAIKKNKLK